MPGCIVSATTASFRSVEKRRLRATPVITSTLENVSDIGTCLGLCLGPPASAGVRSKRGAIQGWRPEEPAIPYPERFRKNGREAPRTGTPSASLVWVRRLIKSAGALCRLVTYILLRN